MHHTIPQVLSALARAVQRNAPGNGGFQTAIPELELYRFRERIRLEAVLCEPSLCVVAQGAKEVSLAGRTYRYDPARFLLVSVGLPLVTSVVEASPREPCLVVRVKLDPAATKEVMDTAGMTVPPVPPARGLEVGPIQPALLDAVARLVQLLDAPADISPLAPLTLREITYRAMTTPQGTVLRQATTTGMPVQRISQVIRWLAEHFAEPLKMSALAERAGMSESAFYAQFKRVTGCSPLRFQKQLRLHEARQVMRREALAAAEAAYRVGYQSPSQFGREYKRLFGKSPRQDVEPIRTDRA